MLDAPDWYGPLSAALGKASPGRQWRTKVRSSSAVDGGEVDTSYSIPEMLSIKTFVGFDVAPARD